MSQCNCVCHCILCKCSEKSESNYELKTLRDEFAKSALIGILANSHNHPSMGNFFVQSFDDEEMIAKVAYRIADAMMKARESKEQE